jgi:hypothetical protein
MTSPDRIGMASMIVGCIASAYLAWSHGNTSALIGWSVAALGWGLHFVRR